MTNPVTNAEPAEKVPAEDFGAAGHLAAIERMYQEGLAHIAFLAQSWARPASASAPAPATSSVPSSVASPAVSPATAPTPVQPAAGPARHSVPVVPMTAKPPLNQQKTAA